MGQHEENKDVRKMKQTLHQWLCEARDFRNDGWVQRGYKEKLLAIHAVTSAALQQIGMITDVPKEKNE